MTARRYLRAYHASKWALKGFTDCLDQEVAAFGIKVRLIEPGGFLTIGRLQHRARSIRISNVSTARLVFLLSNNDERA
ncbi:SDR family NAD(P)-dependent oxidoreductase [Agrobacterium tumefaciens]|uniref:SDR family NAD(P)-dependent oxidoreductase n=1 Tax=Agrobacterium tumefaciens TaxID=358 RepID=UPI001F1796A8|nr:SDR family NAD(P)-dependent oxidoreductase [Agrobacterium tumefaciens]